MKYILIELEERNCGNFYTQYFLDYIDDEFDENAFADDIAATWYDDDDAYKKHDCWYHVDGEIIVKVIKINLLTKEEYEILNKYI